jgi:hypothetical protein
VIERHPQSDDRSQQAKDDGHEKRRDPDAKRAAQNTINVAHSREDAVHFLLAAPACLSWS